MGEMEADELIVLGLTADETGKTNDVDSRLIVTNCTRSCNFFTCFKGDDKENRAKTSSIHLSREEEVNECFLPSAC